MSKGGGGFVTPVFYVPQSFDAGYRLVNDAGKLGETFEVARHKVGLPDQLELPTESFGHAVEIVLKDCELGDAGWYGIESTSSFFRCNIAARRFLRSRRRIAIGSSLAAGPPSAGPAHDRGHAASGE